MPIGGKKKIDLTMDAILSKISPFDIYKYYMPNKDWNLNEVTHSPFSTDNTPSFIIGNKYGHITHIAFNDTSKKGDCFNFVKQLFNLATLDDILKKIDTDFQLGLSNGVVGDYKAITGQYKQPEVTKRNSFIQVTTRKFTNDELAYWNQYHQSLDDLRNNNIYSIKALYFNRQKFPLKETDLRFGYYYPKGGFWKLYIPYAKSKKNKWLSNVPLTTSWGLENLNKEKNTLIVKSLKDYMVCRKIYPYLCGIQNESLAAFSGETIDSIKENSKVVFYGGDSDNPGKEASYLITSTLGYKHINPPDYLRDECCKDFADMGRIKGLESIRQHFLQKNLIENL